MIRKILHGDCIDLMSRATANSIDAIVTDPPYGLAFMGKQWDKKGGPQEFQRWSQEWAEAALRVVKPGGHAVVFGGTRTHHRMMAGLEDAGWEIRDCGVWLYGQGFPKSQDVAKSAKRFAEVDAPEWSGWGTALKPACEPWVLARKPLEASTYKNVLEHGTGALNINGTRIATDEQLQGSTVRDNIRGGSFGNGHRPADDVPDYQQHEAGRWPANVVLDPEAARTMDEQAGGPSRFFYCAKAGTSEKPWTKSEKVKHPTVKPLDLMRWLVRLVTPPEGIVLDPFAGTGTTGEAALLEGFGYVLIEQDEDYLQLIERRLARHDESAA